ncbi:MAG: hypothetical protein HKN23_15340 [Verrucomicrobiales bacterium]|nr:hypothetical protein [Verrucomicrobiales bacterium]
MRLLKTAMTLALCAAACLCLTSSGKKAQKHVITFHLESDESHYPKFATPVKLGSQAKQYYFEIMPSVTEKDIDWFYPFVSKDGRTFGAAFKLQPSRARHLQGLTQENNGKLIGARVVGAQLSATMIDRPIEDGILVIWDGLGREQLMLFKKYFPHVEDLQKARGTADAR